MNTSVAFKSLQDILDQTVDYLCTQVRAAVDPSGRFVYRTPEGNCCGVGSWIPPELYRPIWDTLGPQIGAPVRFLLSHDTEGAPFAAALAAGGIDVQARHVIRLLVVLQDAHDQCSRLRFDDEDGETQYFDTRLEFLDAYIPHLLRQRRYRIPGIIYTPRSTSQD